MKDAAAIIVAAGQGLRFGGPVRKQYLTLRGRPIVWWSLAAFEKSPSIGAIVLVVPPSDVARVRPVVRRWRLKKVLNVVPGGASRAGSVQNGLRALPPVFRWVAVHDGVRPLVRPEAIEKVLAAAKRHQAALAACPATDTVKVADAKGFVRATPDRRRMWLAQTPQIFSRALLERAHRRFRGSAKATDDALMVERLGVPVKLVETSRENMKVTVPVDLALAGMILKGRRL